MSEVSDLKEAVKKINESSKIAFSKIKEEMTEHLDSINQNTNEIEIVYGYLSELEQKLDKLSERIDEIQYKNSEIMEKELNIHLTPREEEIFITLYMASKSMSAFEIAKILSLTEELVNSYIYKLISKGVPIQKEMQKEISYFILDRTFKDMQARKNIIKLNENILQQFAELRF